jgi:hypothetical protein
VEAVEPGEGEISGLCLVPPVEEMRLEGLQAFFFEVELAAALRDGIAPSLVNLAFDDKRHDGIAVPGLDV